MLQIQDGDSAALGGAGWNTDGMPHTKQPQEKHLRSIPEVQTGPWPAKSVTENGKKLPWTFTKVCSLHNGTKGLLFRSAEDEVKATGGILGGMSQTDVEQMSGQFLHAL